MDSARAADSAHDPAVPVDRAWVIEYEEAGLGPDVQLRLQRTDGGTYLTISGAHGLVFTGLHLTRASARSLWRTLDHALAEWERLDPDPARPTPAELGPTNGAPGGY